jgi:hypothetical protein
MIEVHECVLRPQLLAQLFTGDDVAGTREQSEENLEGLLLQLDLDAVFAQFACPWVHLEETEGDDPGLIRVGDLATPAA